MDPLETILNDLKQGKIVIVVDDVDRENEGDLVVAAEYATPQVINFMATHGRGLICLPIDEEIAQRLELSPMVLDNTDDFKTAFTVSIDAVESTTGISAFERSHTIMKAIDPKSTPSDFKRPGHMFPLVAKKGGLQTRQGHTEAAVDLAKLCGLKPAGVICEIMNDDGTMSRREDLYLFAKKYQLNMITIQAIQTYAAMDREHSIPVLDYKEREGEYQI